MGLTTTANLIALIDGQNFLRTAAELHGTPRRWRWHPVLLARLVAVRTKTHVQTVRLYTGIPTWERYAAMRDFWERKIFQYNREGASVEWRQLRYDANAPNGREKGIDVRIALDLVRAAVMQPASSIVIFSQDSDLKEAVDEAKMLVPAGTNRGRIYCAFPIDRRRFRGGIHGADWLPLEKAELDGCIDPVEQGLEDAEAAVAEYDAELLRRYRRAVIPLYDVFANGKSVRGKLLEVRRFPLAALLVVERPRDVLTIRVNGNHATRLEKRRGEIVTLTVSAPPAPHGFDIEDA